ncbi:MAG: thioredoxin-like domain-containing protein [Pseudosphingobacterium sp.]|nr:thioredoxin-like domain-containing protein [Pseudosphingobacterium sp.]
MIGKIFGSLTALLITILGGNVAGQNTVPSPDDVLIEGIYQDTIKPTSANKDKDIEVILRISKFPTVGPGKFDKYVCKVDKQNRFRFVIQSPSDFFYMDIGFVPNNSFKIWWTRDSRYILQKGDRIHCTLSHGYFQFSGKGAEKLECQSQLFKIQYSTTREDLALEKEVDPNVYLEYFSRKRDSLLDLRLANVRKFAPVLGKELTEIMIANCYGMKYYSEFRGQRILRQSYPNKVNAFINTKEFKNSGNNLPQTISEKSLVASPVYCDFLFQKILLESLVFKEGKLDNSKSIIPTAFANIENNYTGLVKEKLLTLFFLYYNSMGNPEIMNHFDQGVTLVKSPDYLEILTDIKQRKSNGKPFFPFEMEDENGSLVRLADFKDKIVILDFWFTGCSGCATLTRFLKPVYEKYKDNPRVKFVTVCIDSDKSMWMKSVKSGVYTHTGSINLYAGGHSASTSQMHPLIKAYDIKSYPTLFILKDTIMFSSMPPLNNNERLMEIIEEAL